MARCPAHEDHDPSLSLRAIEGQALAYCHAGCDTRDVLAALDMTMADLYDEPRGATYRYDDGRIVHRTPNKRFSQSGNTKAPAQLYRASAVAEAVSNGTPVYLVEGEKDVHALESLGVVATTAPMGAGNWSKVDPSPLYGGTVVAVPDADDAGQRWAEAVQASLAGKVDWLRFMAPKVGKDAAEHIASGHGTDDLVHIVPREPYNLVRASDVVPEAVTWLWKGYIPAGKITLIDGDPGEGKSTLTLDIAARVSRGGPMPDGSAGGSGTVLILSAEDGVADTIVPRLCAAGANLRRVHILTEVRGVSDEGNIVTRPVELPDDLPIVERIIREHRVVLVVIDPLMAYLGGTVNSFRDQDIRRALHPLAKLAETTGATFVVVRHLNKSGGGKAIYRGGGSIGIGGAARSVFLVAPDPEDETHARKLLASVKLNIAVKPATMAYRIEQSENGCSCIAWDGTSKFSAQDLTDVEGGHGLPATDLLSEYLSSGSKKATDVARAARDAWGISESTLKRARKKLGVKAVKKGNVWFLKLPKDGSDKDECDEAPSRGSQGVLFKDDPLDPLESGTMTDRAEEIDHDQ